MIQSQQSLRLALVALVITFLSACGGGQGIRGSDRSEEEISRAAQVNTQLGGAYLQRGQYEQALEKLQKALRYDSDYAPAHSTIAILYEQIGDVDSAEKHHKRAVRLDALGHRARQQHPHPTRCVDRVRARPGLRSRAEIEIPAHRSLDRPASIL